MNCYKHGSAAPSSGQEVGGSAHIPGSKIWKRDSGCGPTLLILVEGLGHPPNETWVGWQGPLLQFGSTEGRGGGALHWSVRFDQWRNQLLINKELLISQPGSGVSAVTINNQRAGKLPTSIYAPGFGQQIIKDGRSCISRVMAGRGWGILNKTQNEFAFCSSKGVRSFILFTWKECENCIIYDMWVLFLN